MILRNFIQSGTNIFKGGHPKSKAAIKNNK